jgi:hypothetical protein
LDVDGDFFAVSALQADEIIRLFFFCDISALQADWKKGFLTRLTSSAHSK